MFRLSRSAWWGGSRGSRRAAGRRQMAPRPRRSTRTGCTLRAALGRAAATAALLLAGGGERVRCGHDVGGSEAGIARRCRVRRSRARCSFGGKAISRGESPGRISASGRHALTFTDKRWTALEGGRQARGLRTGRRPCMRRSARAQRAGRRCRPGRGRARREGCAFAPRRRAGPGSRCPPRCPRRTPRAVPE